MKRLNQDEEIGKKYGRLTVIEFINPNEHSSSKLKARCICDCGKENIVRLSNLRSNAVRSCGCMMGDNNRKHDLTREHSKLVYVWEQMMRRCYNPQVERYKDYGGRGIDVCEEWRDIKNFANWALSKGYREGIDSIDRINNDKGYSPENCRLADKFTQASNKRKQKSNTSGYVGVKIRRGSNFDYWTSDITVKYKRYFLGSFLTKKEALDARNEFIKENHLWDYQIQEWKGEL